MSSPPKMRISLPVLTLLLVELAAGQLAYLQLMPESTVREAISISLCAFFHCVLLVVLASGWMAFWLSLPGSYAARVCAYLVLPLGLSALLDYLCFRWVGLHLGSALHLLGWNIASDFRVMADKMGVVILFALSAVASPFAFTLVCDFFSRRYPRFHSEIRLKIWFSGSALVCIALAGSIPLSARSARKETLARRDRLLWVIPPFRIPFDDALSLGNFRIKNLEETLPPTRWIASETPQPAKRPNIFLFVVESLRSDLLDSTIAPHLTQWKKSLLVPNHSIASANCTHISWYSIFHATNPLYWSVLSHRREYPGSLPIRMLKELGYRINVISTPNLEYFGAKWSLFRNDLSLVDSLIDQTHLLSGLSQRTAAYADQDAMTHLLKQIESLNDNSGQFFLVFLDSPHHDYYWPDEFPALFSPFAKTINFLDPKPSSEAVEQLRNRYKNSVHYVDSLIGRFLSALKSGGLMDKSLIVFAGDHGEEFLERGHLVHSSELNRFQLSTPIWFQIPAQFRKQEVGNIPIASHADIFPTLLDAVGIDKKSLTYLQGKSILGKERPSFAVSAHCASGPPDELTISLNEKKLFIEFGEIGELRTHLLAHSARVVKLTGLDDSPMPNERGSSWWSPSLKQEFMPALSSFLELSTKAD